MSLLDKLKKLSGKNKRREPRSGQNLGRGILMFEHTGQVIQAERLLRKAGQEIAVKAPPPELRGGCDLVVYFSLVHEPVILGLLEKAGIKPLQSVPVSGELLEPVSIFQSKELGRYLMVRAANMKITVDRESLLIVNVSGGGCPDVPYLAALLLGSSLKSPPQPLDEASATLCGYALQLALNEARRLCLG